MAADEAYVLDGSALIAHLEGAKGSGRVVEVLETALRGSASVFMSEINLGEVYYIMRARSGAEAAERMVLDVAQLPVALEPASWPRVVEAAELKAGGGLSYADCFAAALSVEADATLLTYDREFSRVEDRVAIEWL